MSSYSKKTTSVSNVYTVICMLLFLSQSTAQDFTSAIGPIAREAGKLMVIAEKCGSSKERLELLTMYFDSRELRSFGASYLQGKKDGEALMSNSKPLTSRDAKCRQLEKTFKDLEHWKSSLEK